MSDIYSRRKSLLALDAINTLYRGGLNLTPSLEYWMRFPRQGGSKKNQNVGTCWILACAASFWIPACAGMTTE
jgi:hypothetical protein